MGAIGATLARLTEVLEAVVYIIGPKTVEARVEAYRKQRLTRAIVTNENEWKERVAAGEAHAVKRISPKSYIFARGPGDKPVCGPVDSVAEPERRALIRRSVGATCTINGQPTVILAAFEDGPAPGKAAKP